MQSTMSPIQILIYEAVLQHFDHRYESFVSFFLFTFLLQLLSLVLWSVGDWPEPIRNWTLDRYKVAFVFQICNIQLYLVIYCLGLLKSFFKSFQLHCMVLAWLRLHNLMIWYISTNINEYSLRGHPVVCLVWTWARCVSACSETCGQT